jgi:hypothetical protein
MNTLDKKISAAALIARSPIQSHFLDQDGVYKTGTWPPAT